jgi:hypothetical protein
MIKIFASLAAMLLTLGSVGCSDDNSSGSGFVCDPDRAFWGNAEISECSEGRASRLHSWHAAMLDMPPDSDGCHEVTHPSMEWEEVACDEAKILTAAPGRRVAEAAQRSESTLNVGFDKNYALQVGSVNREKEGYFTLVSGSFRNLIGVTSITDHRGTKRSPDKWTLQLNTNVFDTPDCDPFDFCVGWQQAIYAQEGQGAQGELFIMSHLSVDITPENGLTCPPGWIDGNTGLQRFRSFGCYRFSPVKSVPGVAVSDLEHVRMTKGSGVTGEFVILRVDDTLYRVNTAPADSQTSYPPPLYKNFWIADFNIFGYGNSEAVFSDNSSMDVMLSVDGYVGDVDITCRTGGYEDSSNSMTVRGECSEVEGVIVTTGPLYRFTQDNFPIEVIEYSGSCDVPSTPCNFITTECMEYVKCRCEAEELPLILGTGQYRSDYSELCKDFG